MSERDDTMRGSSGGAADGGAASSPAIFDDDRLLAFALGLEDDVELSGALVGDAVLSARLEAMRGELGQIESGIRSAVPPEPDAYTDLADPRWDGLRPYVQHAEDRPGRSFGWGRIVSYAGAAALVALVGVFVVAPAAERSREGRSSTSISAVKSVPLTESGTGTMGGESTGAGSVAAAGSVNVPSSAVAQAADSVVVVRAGAQDGQRQQVTVLRVLKGEKPAAGRLTVPATGALIPGERYIVYLPGPASWDAGMAADRTSGIDGSADPDISGAGGTPAPGSPNYGGSPAPGSPADPFALDGDLSGLILWSGLPVFVEAVPKDASLESITLP